MKNDTMHRLIRGQLKSCIKAHGPISKEWIGSAAMRIEHAVAAIISEPLLEEYRKSVCNEYALVEHKHLKYLKKRTERQAKTIRDLLKMMDDVGIHPAKRKQNGTEESIL